MFSEGDVGDERIGNEIDGDNDSDSTSALAAE
jgi:hypothetical protein